MNELLAITVLGTFLSVAFIFVFPRAKNVVQLRWLDLLFSALTLGVLGAIFGTRQESQDIFGLPWFVFGLVVYVAMETPLWVRHMRKHPEQGTLAQLYGLAPVNSTRYEQNFNNIMNDTKWDVIRTSRIQKALVIIGVLSIVVAPLAMWFENEFKPGIGILFVVPIFATWWLIRISVRLVADAPEQYLDEYQVQVRDRTYVHSFRILAALCALLALSLMLVVFSSDVVSPTPVETYSLEFSFNQVNAIIWLILGVVILTPNLVLAWNQSKRVNL